MRTVVRPDCLDRLERLLEPRRRPLVEAGGRLVEDQQLRLGSSACASRTRRSSPPDSTASGRRATSGSADPFEQACDRLSCGPREAEADRPPLPREREKILDGHRQRGIDGERSAGT